jgi:hypothetical protein
MRKIYISILSVAVSIFMVGKVAAQYSEPQVDQNVPAITAAIVIDGEADASYSADQDMFLAKAAGAALGDYGTFDAADFQPTFKFCWDWNYIYLWMHTSDDIEESLPEGGANQWTWDNSEFFLDIDTNSTTNTYGATSTAQFRFNRGDFGGITSPVRGRVSDFKVYQDNGADYWGFEVAVPWFAAGDTSMRVGDDATPVFAAMKTRLEAIKAAGEPIGFDFAVADADGAGGGTEGGRNVEGGQQGFWDKDTPIGNEDNAYQNRRTFGWIRLEGTPVVTGLVNNNASVYGVNYNANGSVTVTNLANASEVNVYSLVGAKVATYKVTESNLTISGLTAGVYVVSVDNNTNIKVVVK